MKHDVLVLNGSPRPGGNTELLANALIEGVESAGKTAKRIDICRLSIGPCVACYGCAQKRGNPCVQQDDMAQIYAALDEASSVVFASPLYWWHFTAQMKTVIDRLFAVYCYNRHIAPKNVAMVIAAGDAAAENFAQIVPYYKTCLVENIHWNDKGYLLAGGLNDMGDAVGTHWLEDARQLGTKL